MAAAFQKMLELHALDRVGPELCKAPRRACRERRGLRLLLPSGNRRSLNQSHVSIREKVHQARSRPSRSPRPESRKGPRRLPQIHLMCWRTLPLLPRGDISREPQDLLCTSSPWGESWRPAMSTSGRPCPGGVLGPAP